MLKMFFRYLKLYIIKFGNRENEIYKCKIPNSFGELPDPTGRNTFRNIDSNMNIISHTHIIIYIISSAL